MRVHGFVFGLALATIKEGGIIWVQKSVPSKGLTHDFQKPILFKCSKIGHLSVDKVDAGGNSMPLKELNKLDSPLEVPPMTAIMGNGTYLERFVVSVH